jgi:periplasmic protein TonB
MIALASDDIADLRRWAASAAVVVFAYGSMAWTMINWRDTFEPAEPAAAIVVEFAPLPVAPEALQADIPPGPEMVMSDASPNKPTESVEEKLEEKIEQTVEARIDQKVEKNKEPTPPEELSPEVTSAPNPEVVVPTPQPQQVKQEAAKRQDPRLPAPTTSTPHATPEQTAAIAAAPTQGQPNPNASKALPTWKTQIIALLERNKRYPAAAQSRHQQGIAQVSFSLDRQGRLIESRIVRSSGAAALDEEALALLHRAQPFPKPPEELTGQYVGLTVPIRFNLK